MTAREKFPIGQRVTLTERGRAVANPRHCTGTVKGYGRHGKTVRVLVDGMKSIQSWHMGFWEPIQ